MLNNFMARGKRKAIEAAPATSGMNALMQNKAAIALLVILILAAYFVMQGVPQVGSPTATTAPPSIKTETEAGGVISDLSNSAVDAGSILKDIDNSIG